MSILTADDGATTMDSPVQRVVAVVRLHTVNLWTSIYIPLMILSFIFVVNYAVWHLVAQNSATGDASTVNSGGTAFVLIYMLVVAVQVMNSSFRFALGFGATRRDFYLGSAAYFVILSLFYSVLMSMFAAIERVTDGWGLRATFFAPDVFGTMTNLETFYTYFTLLLLFFFVGAAIAAIYVRWKTNGMWAFWAVVAALVVGAAYVITITDRWPAVGDFFVSAGIVGTLTWTLVVSAAAGITGFFLLRRATSQD